MESSLEQLAAGVKTHDLHLKGFEGMKFIAITQLSILMTNILINLSRSGQKSRPTLLNL